MMCQRLLEVYEEKLLSFLHKFIVGMGREHDSILTQIGNDNQTPICFDGPENMIVTIKGKSVHVRTTSAEGHCLYAVFKRKHVPPAQQFPEGIFV